MSDLLNEPQRVERTRADHRCGYCNRVIPKGSRGIIAESGICDGYAFRRYQCHHCEPFVEEFWEWCGYGSDVIEIDFECFMAERHPNALKQTKELDEP